MLYNIETHENTFHLCYSIFREVPVRVKHQTFKDEAHSILVIRSANSLFAFRNTNAFKLAGETEAPAMESADGADIDSTN